MNIRGLFTGCLMAAGLVMASGSAADALTLTLATNGASTTVSDADNDGVVAFGGALGAFSVNGSIGFSQPAIGSSNVAMLDLSSFHVGGSGDLTITLTDIGFDLPWTSQSAVFDIAGLTSGSVTASALANGTQFGDTLALGPGDYSDITSALLALGSGPFDLSLEILITHGIGGFTSFDASTALTAVPLPAALPLFLGALAMLGFLGRRRRQVGPAVG